jgi:hypothetical protein
MNALWGFAGGLIGATIGSMTAMWVERHRQGATWRERTAKALADLELFWPLADPYRFRSMEPDERDQAVRYLKTDWKTIRHGLEFVKAGYRNKRIKDKIKKLIADAEASIFETSALWPTNDRERPREALDMHQIVAKGIDGSGSQSRWAAALAP